jgi:hypothetical protein
LPKTIAIRPPEASRDPVAALAVANAVPRLIDDNFPDALIAAFGSGFRRHVRHFTFGVVVLALRPHLSVWLVRWVSTEPPKYRDPAAATVPSNRLAFDFDPPELAVREFGVH